MRVIDFGQVTALRSQSVWHALCRAVRPGDDPVLSFVRPGAPYVCLGRHRDLAEVDTAYCARRGLPVYRRMVGGGPVYLDPDQWFFQICLPARAVPARRSAALAELLAPAALALRSLGVDAELDRYGEISVGPAKVCGHGAGQLRDGVVVVGNLITAFDHGRAARVLRLDPDMREAVTRLMREHVAATPIDPERWQAAMVREYSARFGSLPVPAKPTSAERRELRAVDVKLGRPDFVTGEQRPPRPVRTVKVRAGVWVHDWRDGAERLVLGVAGGAVTSAAGVLDGVAPAELVGLSVERVRAEFARAERTSALARAMAEARTEVMAA
jgi:lipoate-protein ligase A